MLYNLHELWDLTDGDKEIVTSMVVQFIKDVPPSVNNIKIALKLGDRSSIKFNAHRIKPAINSLKIDSLRKTIIAIEEKAESNSLDDELLGSVKELDNVIAQVVSALKAEFKL